MSATSPPQDPAHQLDLFADSRDVMLRNDLIDALLGRDAAGARQAQARLAAEYPGDAALADAALLVQALADAPTSPLASLEFAQAARAALAGQLMPAARRVLGAVRQPAWTAPLWARLAERAAGLPFRPDSAAGHAAALWIEAGRWQAAAAL